jgi:hypothetical protein
VIWEAERGGEGGGVRAWSRQPSLLQGRALWAAPGLEGKEGRTGACAARWARTRRPRLRPRPHAAMGAQGSKVPEWLSEVMKEDEVDVLKDVMNERGLEEEDLRFFSDKALKEAGVKSAITRAMMLRRIREHHKKRKREEADEDEVVLHCTIM